MRKNSEARLEAKVVDCSDLPARPFVAIDCKKKEWSYLRSSRQFVTVRPTSHVIPSHPMEEE